LTRFKKTSSASAARYRLTLPFLAISREIEDGARLSSLAMLLMLAPLARLRDMNSRSSNDNASGQRLRVRGSIPPGYGKQEKTVAGGYSMSAAIKLIGLPCCQSSQILYFLLAVIGP